MKKTLSLIAAVLLLAALSFAYAENLPGPDTSKTVKSIEIYQNPDKMEYVIGDTFSADGGILKITYDDGTEGYLSLTDDSVTVKAPTMNTANTKNVQVKYGGAKLTYKVEVSAGMCQVAFVSEGETVSSVQVGKGAAVDAPAEPTRDGYTFLGWYADADYTRLFDFSAKVTEDTAAYALWILTDAARANVTFDCGYYGLAVPSYTYPVAVGAAVSQPTIAPVRVGYEFDCWMAPDGSAYDFAEAVTQDITLTASWHRTSTESATWVFEAEDTDLTGKIGPSFSGAAQETGMIVFNEDIGASGSRVVGFQYDNGMSLEFYIVSDMDVEDATLVLRGTGEYVTMSYDGSEYQIIVNGTVLDYPEVTIEIADQNDVPPVRDIAVVSGVKLKAGANLIQLKTANNKEVERTTFKANAPMVDCIQITTNAVLTWDGNHAEPAANY